MKRFGLLVLCLCVVALVSFSMVLLPTTRNEYTATELYSEYLSCIVDVFAKENIFSHEVYRGTGFFVDAGGRFVTAAHVLYFEESGEVAGQVRVTIGDEKPLYKAEVLKVDLEHDVALLRILQFSDFSEDIGYVIDHEKMMGLDRRFAHVTLDYDYEARAGDLVFTLGHPSQFKDVISQGMVISSRLADIEIDEELLKFDGMVLTSLYIMSGNSGGPVFNGAGHVIGVATVGSGVGPMSLFQPAKYIGALLEDKSDDVVISQQHKMPADKAKVPDKEEGEDSDEEAVLP